MNPSFLDNNNISNNEDGVYLFLRTRLPTL
ncbi:hypothetical protein [Terribacillus saccharophilus]